MARRLKELRARLARFETAATEADRLEEAIAAYTEQLARLGALEAEAWRHERAAGDTAGKALPIAPPELPPPGDILRDLVRLREAAGQAERLRAELAALRDKARELG